MAVYPTRTGFHLEVTWDDAAKAADIPVQITSSDTVQTYGGNGTLVFRKNGQIGAVITHPLLFSPGEETPRWDIAGGIRIEDSSQGCFTFILPEDRAREGPLTALLSFDLYENQAPRHRRRIRLSRYQRLSQPRQPGRQPRAVGYRRPVYPVPAAVLLQAESGGYPLCLVSFAGLFRQRARGARPI